MIEETRTKRGGAVWQAALTILVAPFYVGLFIITAVGAAFADKSAR
jgi:hypothetical protein